MAIGTVLLVAAVSLLGSQPDQSSVGLHPRPARVSTNLVEGTAELLPARIAAGAIGTYELRLTLDENGLDRGGRVLVGFPKTWFTNPFPIAKRLQQADSGKAHFLTVSASRQGASFTAAVDTMGFGGEIERFNQTVLLTNTGAALRRGDIVSVALANTTAPYVSGHDEVAVAIDATGVGRFGILRHGGAYDVDPGEAEYLTLVGPTEAVKGQPAELHVTAFDRFANVAERFDGAIDLAGMDRPRTLRLTPAARGTARLTWTPMKDGFFFPEGTVRRRGSDVRERVAGNPVRVFSREPTWRTYWGELHSHSAISADGIGSDAYPYARDAAHLDFFAATEHADDDGNPAGDAIRPDEWRSIRERVTRYQQPGRFVTLLAYECSFPAPIGHHNVFFRAMDGAPWPAAELRSVENLWARIAAGQAITIPHHTGIAFQGAPPGASAAGPQFQPIITAARGPLAGFGASVDWKSHDPLRRPLLEIYSLHGSSETYDPEDPLSYENAHFTFSRSVPGPHYARDAWAAGLELGVVAATDDHTARPGQPHGGVTAVRAARLTREAVFDGLASRHTYGTTGQRLYMEFSIGGADMGDSGSSNSPVKGQVTLAAPSAIAKAEVLRRQSPEGDFVVVAHWENVGRTLVESVVDTPRAGEVMYFLRVELTDKVRGRPVRGWSSPVWLHID